MSPRNSPGRGCRSGGVSGAGMDWRRRSGGPGGRRLGVGGGGWHDPRSWESWGWIPLGECWRGGGGGGMTKCGLEGPELGSGAGLSRKGSPGSPPR